VDIGERRRIRVLLVEDDAGDAFLVRELLAEVQAPVDLSVVSTVAEATAMVDAVDCVLLDLDLPDASGLSALHLLLTARPHAAVCVLTGLSEERLGEDALAHGAQDYLIKSRVDGVLLERAIRYAVERRRAEDSALRLRESELRQAESSRLERGLLPHPLVDEVAVELRGFYRAGRQLGVLGGDFYDAVQTGPHRISILVGDVCGHAAEEAALGVELRVAWRALTLAGVGDDDLLATLERILVSERRADEIFATLAMVTVDVETGRAAVRTAGHPPPVLIDGGSVRPLQLAPSVVLGLLPGRSNESTDVPLPDGSWGILTYTDGLIEARDDGDWLGTDGLCRMIEAYIENGGHLTALPEWLVAEAERRNGGPLADDVAMLLLTGDNAPLAATSSATASLAATSAAALGRQPTTARAESSVAVGAGVTAQSPETARSPETAKTSETDLSSETAIPLEGSTKTPASATAGTPAAASSPTLGSRT
jgi:serine phosphatase RsbU (regulator of sigma subunit)